MHVKTIGAAARSYDASDDGQLTPITGSNQPCAGRVCGPAAPRSRSIAKGEQLIVSERQTDNLATYQVDDSGRAGPPRSNATTEIGPFGLNLAGDDVLLAAVNNGALPLLGGSPCDVTRRPGRRCAHAARRSGIWAP